MSGQFAQLRSFLTLGTDSIRDKANEHVVIVYTRIYNCSMFVLDVCKTLDKSKVKYAVVGGYALALHGIVRATMDVDLVIQISKNQLNRLQSSLKLLNLTSRLPIEADQVFEFLDEYIHNRNLIAWSFVDYQDPSKVVDILLTEDIKNLKVKKISVAGQKIAVASLEDLLRMKEKSNRPKDALDIESIKLKLKG